MSIKKHIAFLALISNLSLSQAATLGQITINNQMSGSRTITYETVDGFAVVEGDILLGKVNELNAPSAIVKTKVGGSRWPQGIIPFQISEYMPFMNKLSIFKAIDYLQKNTTLEFIELNTQNRKHYPDSILFIPTSGTTCSSYVGRMGRRQEINLAPRCNTMNTVHEIGHAIGLWHEQSRADRNNYIRIVFENIQEEELHNFDQQLNDGKDIGEYDYQSIMHYGPYAFSKNGEKTIIPLSEGVEIGQRNQLSEKDIAAIAAMYPQA